MKKIFLLATDISSVPSICNAIELFSTANILSNIQSPGATPLFEWKVVASDKIVGTYGSGLDVSFSNGLRPFEKADIVIAAGFIYRNEAELTEKIKSAEHSVRWLSRQHNKGAIVCAACSGTVLLASARLLDNIPATTSWWLDGFYRRHYPKVKLHIDQILVEHDRIITAGAATSFFNLVHVVIRKTAGNQLARACSKMMLIDVNKSSQAQYAMRGPVLDHSDSVVTKAQFYLNQNLQSKIDFKELARHHAVSYRTFLRRFVEATGESPIKYLQKIRIEAAKSLLETSDLNLESIMERVGYSDPASFSQLFKRTTHLTPIAYRRQFG